MTTTGQHSMRLVHVLPSVSEEASGPSYSVTRLCASLNDIGDDVTLAALKMPPVPASAPAFLRLFPAGLGPRRLGRLPRMRRWLASEVAAGRVDVIHNHGMWQLNSLYPAWSVPGTRSQLVVSPRGALSAWAMRSGSSFKGVFWQLAQRPALMRAACFHATADAECGQIRDLGFRQPVAVIPNGVDIPEVEAGARGDMRTLLFLGRIHPTKGLDMLLHAWAAVTDRFRDWRLRIVGTDTSYLARRGGYLQEMKTLAESLRLARVVFDQPLYGQAKWEAYAEADLFVLPTHTENFGMVVAESLAAGTPAIVSKGAPWSGLDTHTCGWWIDSGINALAAALEYAMGRSRDDLAERGRNGRLWMRDEFSWPEAATKMHLTYRWLTRGGATPSWVRL